MKKVIFTTVMMLMVSMGSYAQYFHHLYGSSFNETCTDGVVTDFNAHGHLIVGEYSDYINGGGYVSVAWTDEHGSVQATVSPPLPVPPNFYFSNSYNVQTNSTNPVDLYTSNPRCMELQPVNFAVMGNYTGVQTGLFYMQLDRLGNIVTTKSHTTAGNYYLELKAICKDYMSTYGYATGTAIDNITNERHLFIYMFVQNTGQIIWSHIYDIDLPGVTSIVNVNQMIMSPINNEVVVVGSILPMSGAGYSLPLLARFNAGSGAAVAGGILAYQPTLNQFDGFTSICDGLNSDYVCAGYTNMNGNREFMEVKVSSTGVHNISKVHPYLSSIMRNLIDEPSGGITSRFNINNQPEYFHAGVVQDGNLGGIGNSDVLVYKLDNNLNPVGQYTYGTTGSESSIRITTVPPPQGDGFAVYGSAENSAHDMDLYIIKAYYNGVSGCNQELLNTTSNNWNYLKTNTCSIIDRGTITDSPLKSRKTDIPDEPICYTFIDTTGDNSFLVPTEDPNNVNSLLVSPNPMLPGVSTATVNIQSSVNEEVKVVVYDMLGKQYYTGVYTIKEGNNSFSFELPTNSMAKGMYTVSLIGVTTHKTVRLMVQ